MVDIHINPNVLDLGLLFHLRHRPVVVCRPPHSPTGMDQVGQNHLEESEFFYRSKSSWFLAGESHDNSHYLLNARMFITDDSTDRRSFPQLHTADKPVTCRHSMYSRGMTNSTPESPHRP
jgi:hypothetical protein